MSKLYPLNNSQVLKNTGKSPKITCQVNVAPSPAQSVAFRDANPVSPVHVLIIPRKPLPTLSQATDQDTEVCMRR